MNGMNANAGVILLVDDIEKMVSFYKNIMEFETEWESEPDDVKLHEVRRRIYTEWVPVASYVHTERRF